MKKAVFVVVSNYQRISMPNVQKKQKRGNIDKPACGLCGKRKKLIQTDCCRNWICNDEDNYVVFSYARNSCSRNHRRYTLCAAHDQEQHSGDWQSCNACKKLFPTEMYDWYGTNEYNFEKLKALLPFTPAQCAACSCMIFISQEGYCSKPDGSYLCEQCYE